MFNDHFLKGTCLLAQMFCGHPAEVFCVHQEEVQRTFWWTCKADEFATPLPSVTVEDISVPSGMFL